MKKMDEALSAEEKVWRQKTFSEIKTILGKVECYRTEYEGVGYQFEIHTKDNTDPGEIIVMVECSKDSFLGSFTGRCR
jgi:hypothetical protein